MDIWYIISLIVIIVLVILMMRVIILNHHIRILNDRSNKLFHYFSVPILTNCMENEAKIKVGQLFKREYTTADNLGYTMKNMELTLIGKTTKIDNEGTEALILKRLYFIPTDNIMKQYVSVNKVVNEDDLMNNNDMYLEYNNNLHAVEVWCGKYRLEEYPGGRSIKVVKDINKILNFIYKECQMKGRSISPLLGDFYIYYKMLRGDNE